MNKATCKRDMFVNCTFFPNSVVWTIFAYLKVNALIGHVGSASTTPLLINMYILHLK